MEKKFKTSELELKESFNTRLVSIGTLRKPRWRRQRGHGKTKDLRACLHGGGGPQVSEVTHLSVVLGTLSSQDGTRLIFFWRARRDSFQSLLFQCRRRPASRLGILRSLY